MAKTQVVKPKVDLTWYEGPLSKKHIAELREKLGKARGILIEIQLSLKWGEDTFPMPSCSDIDEALRQSKD